MTFCLGECGRFGLWYRFVAVLVCGRFGFHPLRHVYETKRVTECKLAVEVSAPDADTQPVCVRYVSLFSLSKL